MFRNEIIERRVIIDPVEIRRNPIDRDVDKSQIVDNILTRKIKEMYGDRCIDTGYVDASTIQIVERSIGRIYAEHLNGNIVYDVRFSADVCCPVKGDEVVGRVTNSNKMGLLVKHGPLNIVLARQHHVNRKCFKRINIGDDIPVSIVGSRFSLNDKQISVIGYLGDVTEYIDEEDVEMEDTSVVSTITDDDDTESVVSELF
tara:strand:- start:61 stop:663 length:603 start_codon:yes stop_codon:yes gene_type:complete